MKRIIPVLLTSLLLCSCGFNQDRTNEVFEVGEIKGSTYFADVSALTNKEDNTLIFKYNDFTSQPCKIKNYNGVSYDFEREDTPKDSLGVTHHTYHHWFMFDVALNEEDKAYMCQTLQSMIDAKIALLIENTMGEPLKPEVSFLETNKVTGVAIGLIKTKYDGKYTKDNHRYIYAILGNYSGFYNGNIQYAKPGDSNLG